MEIQDDMLHLKDLIQILRDSIIMHDENGYLWEFIDIIFDRTENLLGKIEDFQFIPQVSKEILQHFQDSDTCE